MTMRPIFARYINKYHGHNEGTDERFYFLKFQVKFDSGNIETLKIYTNEGFQEPINSQFSITDKMDGRRLRINFCQKGLFDSWKSANEDPARNNLYSFHCNDLGEEDFTCEKELDSEERLANIFTENWYVF
jgi:hypothetical protein